MTRARTGSHSRTEPGAVHEYEVVDHGVDNAQYFQGCGVAHTQWDDVAVGVGNTPLDAYEDAVEALAQGGWEVDALPERPRGLRRTGDLDLDRDAEMQHFVCVYVRGIPTRRTRMAQQFRAGTVGPGRPGQQFTHGDVEIETTLHPIDLDGGGFQHPPGSLDDADTDDLAPYELVYSTGGHGGPHHGLDAAKRWAEKLMRGGREHWIAVVPTSQRPSYENAVWILDTDGWQFTEAGEAQSQRRYHMNGLDGALDDQRSDTWSGSRYRSSDGVSGVSPRTRLGTRVRFAPNPASHMLYSARYGLPERGEEGTVTYMPGFKPKTYMQGPGGGLLYVEWDQAGVLGVSPNDVVKAGEADPYQQYRVGAVDDDDAAEAPTFDWQNAEYFGAYLEGDEGVGTGAYVATAKFKGTWWAMVDTQGPDGVLLRKGGFKSQHAAYAVATKRAERWIAAVQDAG